MIVRQSVKMSSRCDEAMTTRASGYRSVTITCVSSVCGLMFLKRFFSFFIGHAPESLKDLCSYILPEKTAPSIKTARTG